MGKHQHKCYEAFFTETSFLLFFFPSNQNFILGHHLIILGCQIMTQKSLACSPITIYVYHLQGHKAERGKFKIHPYYHTWKTWYLQLLFIWGKTKGLFFSEIYLISPNKVLHFPCYHLEHEHLLEFDWNVMADLADLQADLM